MENRIVDEEQKETLSMSKMLDVEMNLEIAEYSKVKKKRRSSILKPPRVPLQDIDLNINDNDGEGRRKHRRSSRRVSFADTFQIVEFHTENKDYDHSEDNKVETEEEANIKDADNQVFLENDKQDEFLLPSPTELLNPVPVGENILLAKSMSRNSESDGKRTTEDQSKKETENNNLESSAIPNLAQKPSKTMFDLYMTATYDSHISTDYETLWHTSLNKYSYCGNFELDQVSLESEKEEICNIAREEGETAQIISEIETIGDFLKSKRESSSLLALVSKPILSPFPEVGSSDSTVKETSDFGRRISDCNFESEKQKANSENSVFDRLNETCVLPTDMNITCLDDSFKEQSFQPGLFSTSFAKHPEEKQNKKIATNVIKQHRYNDSHPKFDAYSLRLGKGKQYVEQNAAAQDSSVSSDLEKICTKLTDIAVLCKGEELMPSINIPAFSSGKEDEAMQMTCALPTALHNLNNLNTVLNINTPRVQNETNLNTSCTDMDLTCESLGNCCVNQSRFPHVMENILEKKETNSEDNHPSIKNLEYDTFASVSNCARKNNSVPNLLFCNKTIVPENNVKRTLNEAINSIFHSKSIQNNYSPDMTEKVWTNKFNLSTHADMGLTHATLDADCNKENMLITSKEKPESTKIKQKRNDVSDFIHNKSDTFSVVPNLNCNNQNSSDSMYKSNLNAEENFKEISQSFSKSEIIAQVPQNSKISPQTTPTLSNSYDSEYSKNGCLRDKIIRELPCLNTKTAEILPFTKLPENLSDTWQSLSVSKQQSGLLHNIKTGYQEEDMDMTCAVFLNQTHEREENFDTGVTIQTNVLQDTNLPSTISKIKQNNIANEIKVDKKVQDKLSNHAYCKETMFFPSSAVLISEDMEETCCFHTEIEMQKSLNPVKSENSKKLSNVFECYPVYFNVPENNRNYTKSSTLNDQALNLKTTTSYGADACENEKVLSDNFISIDNSSNFLNNTSSEEESDRTIYFDKQVDFTCNLRGENILQNISVHNYNRNTSVYVEQNSSEKTFEDLQNPDAVGDNFKLQHNEQVTVNNKATNSALWKDKFDLKENCSLYNQNKSVCNSGMELTAVNQKSVYNKKPSETQIFSSADMEMTCAIRQFEGDEEATNHIVSSQLTENMHAIGETSECTKDNTELFHIGKETSGANNICSEQRQNFEQNTLNNQDASVMQRNKNTLCNTVANEVISKDKEINADASAKMNYENLSASRTFYFDKQVEFTCNLKGESNAQNVIVHNDEKNTSIYAAKYSSEKNSETFQNHDAVKDSFKLQHNKQVTINDKVKNETLDKGEFVSKGNCSLYDQNKSVYDNGMELTLVNCKSLYSKEATEKTQYFSSVGMELTCNNRQFQDVETTDHISSSQLIENLHATVRTIESANNIDELSHVTEDSIKDNYFCSAQKENLEQSSPKVQDPCPVQKNKNVLCNTVAKFQKLNEVSLNQTKEKEIDADASAKINCEENLNDSKTIYFNKQVEFTCNFKGESNAQNDERNTSVYAKKYNSEKNSENLENLDSLRDSSKLQHNKQMAVNNKVKNETLGKGEFVLKGNCSMYDQNKYIYSKETTEKTQYFSSVGMEITCDNRQFHSDMETTGHDGSSQLIENMHDTVGTIECTKHTDNSFHVVEEISRDNICSIQKENFETSSLDVQDSCTMQRNNALCNTVITLEKLNDVTTLNQRKQTEIDINTPKISHESINASKGKLQDNMKFMAEGCGYIKSTKLLKNNASSQKIHTPEKNSETAAFGDFYRSLSKRTRVINLRHALRGKHNRKIETSDIKNDSVSIRNENSVLHCLDHASLQEKYSSVHHSNKVDQECSFQHNSEQKLQCISENSITLGTELMITNSSEKNGNTNDQKESAKIENFKKIPRKHKFDILYKIKQAKKLALEQGDFKNFNFPSDKVSSESVKQLSSSSSNASCKVVSEMEEREKDFDLGNSYIENSGAVLQRKTFLYETNVAFANDSASSQHVRVMDRDEILDVNIIPMEDIKSNTDVHNYSGIESLINKSLPYRLRRNQNIENDIKGTNEINDQQPQKFATVADITRCEYLNGHSNEKEASNFESFVGTTSSGSLQNNSNKTKPKLHSEQKELSLEANKTNLYFPNESMDNTQDSLQLLPKSVIEDGNESLLLTEKYTSECVERRNGGAIQGNRSDFNFCKPHPVEQLQTKCLRFPVLSREASPSDFNGHVSNRSITREEKSSRTRSVNNTVSTCSNFDGMEHSETEFLKFPDLANKTSTSDLNERMSASSRDIALEEKSSRVISGNSLVSNYHKPSIVKFTHCSNETTSSDINELLSDNSKNNAHRKETSHVVSENISTLLPDSLDRSRSALKRSKIFSEKRVLLERVNTSSTKGPVLVENPENNIHLSSKKNSNFKTNTFEDGNALHLEEKNKSNASDEQCNVNPSDNMDVPENGLMCNLTGEEKITTVLKEKRKYPLSKTRNQSQKCVEECDKSLFISTNNSNKNACAECDSRNIPVSSVPSSEISQIDVTSKDGQEIKQCSQNCSLVTNENEGHISEVTLQNGSKLQVCKYSDEDCVNKIRLFEKNDEKMFSDEQRNSSHMQENNQVENVNKNQTEHDISVQTVAEMPVKNDEPYDEHIIEDQIMKELFKSIGDATSQNCLWEIKEFNKLKIVVSFIWKTLLVSISFGEKQSIRQDKTLQFFKEVSDISFESKFGVETCDVVQLSHSLFHKALEDTNLKEKYSNSSLVLQLFQHLSSAANRAEMLILDVEHILIRHTYFLQSNSEFCVEVLSLGLGTKYLLLFPLQLESYPFQKIVPSVQHMTGNTLSEAKMKKVLAEVIPGENYMWRMVQAVEDLFRALCK